MNIKFVKEVYKNSICERNINIIYSAQEGAYLITKQGTLKKSLMRYSFEVVTIKNTVWRWPNKLLTDYL